MKKRNILFLLIVVLLFGEFSYSQQKDKPKLVIGIIIDQMRSEYLYRFQDNYSENGFKRLLRGGFNVKNTHYNYIPTETGPGHSSVYSGTTPANHGIVANDWYERESMSEVYCAEDKTVRLVDHSGIEKEVNEFSRSPKNIMCSTITDEFKLFTNKRAKVIGISLKDRGAIMPAGHMADYAIWYNIKNGHFITSSYYSNKLPNWLMKFNNQKIADSLLSLQWNTYLPIDEYVNSNPDDVPFERIYKGNTKSVFPYDLRKLSKNNGGYELLMQTPYGNTLLTKLAKATITEEKLGQHSEMDFLTISYSSTDKVGHDYGIRSKEIEDTYVRLDREIAELLSHLDNTVGKDNYVLFLTADHAGSDNPKFLKSEKLPGKFFDIKQIKEELNSRLSLEFGAGDYVSYIDHTQIYINSNIVSKKLILEKAEQILLKMEGVKEVCIPELKSQNIKNNTLGLFFINSYNQKNSGDIIYQMNPGWMINKAYGTSHSTSYTSDTHVPLLWYGWSIPKGQTVNYHSITQIAPTLSMLLNIPFPNSSERNVIEEIFTKY